MRRRGGRDRFFFPLPSPRNQLKKKKRKICLQLSLSAPDGCTMSRRKQAKPQHIDSDEPASLGNGKFTHGMREFWSPRKKNPQRATSPCRVSHRRHFNKVSSGASFQQCSPRTLTCCRPIKLSRSQIQVAFLGSDFFPPLQSTIQVFREGRFFFLEKTHQYAFIFPSLTCAKG